MHRPDVREIHTVVIAGREVAAAKVVCPECQVLDLNTSFDTTHRGRWIASCTQGHTWQVFLTDD